MSDWNADWNAAIAEMAAAETQYEIADKAMAEATARLRSAQNQCATLFRQRMRQVEAT